VNLETSIGPRDLGLILNRDVRLAHVSMGAQEGHVFGSGTS